MDSNNWAIEALRAVGLLFLFIFGVMFLQNQKQNSHFPFYGNAKLEAAEAARDAAQDEVKFLKAELANYQHLAEQLEQAKIANGSLVAAQEMKDTFNRQIIDLLKEHKTEVVAAYKENISNDHSVTTGLIGVAKEYASNSGLPGAKQVTGSTYRLVSPSLDEYIKSLSSTDGN